MKILNLSRSAQLCLALSLLSTGMAKAQTTVFIDFGTGSSDVQSGFTAQTSGSANYTTDAGLITVVSSGNFFNRSSGGGYTDAFLMGDFTFENTLTTNALTFTISGAGISASTDYEIQFFSYDSQHTSGGGTVTYAGTSGTAGGTSIAYSNSGQNDPGFADSNSATATFTSNSSSIIEIGVTGTTEGPRINGMIITVVPEPSAAALLGVVGILYIFRRRR